MVLWDVTLCCLLHEYWPTHYFILCPEDVVMRFLKHTGAYMDAMKIFSWGVQFSKGSSHNFAYRLLFRLFRIQESFLNNLSFCINIWYISFFQILLFLKLYGRWGGGRYLACPFVPASMGTHLPNYMVSQINIFWRGRKWKTLSLISVYSVMTCTYKRETRRFTRYEVTTITWTQTPVKSQN